MSTTTITQHRFDFPRVRVSADLPDLDVDLKPQGSLSYHPASEAAFNALVDRLGGLAAFDPIDECATYPQSLTQAREHHGVKFTIRVYLPYGMDTPARPTVNPTMARLRDEQAKAATS